MPDHRLAVVVALVALAIGASACGSDDPDEGLLARCDGGRSMTVDDPAGDGKPYGSDTAKPKAFDVRRVQIATTDRWLCVSVLFGAGDPPMQGGGLTTRSIVLELLTVPPTRRERRTPANVLFGLGEAGVQRDAEWTPDGFSQSPDLAPQLLSAQVRGERTREVQLVVPIVEMWRASSYRGGETPGDVPLINPASFAWRVSVHSDCTPGPRQLIVFPTGRRITLSDERDRVPNSCR